MISVYNYDDPVDFLSSSLNELQANDPDFSMKDFSKKIGLNSPVPLIDILRRKKKIKDSLTSKILEALNIDPSEKMYFEAIVAKTNAQSDEKRRMYDLLLKELSPAGGKEFKPFYTEKLNIFSHWIYTAILSLAKVEDFELNAQNIQNKLIEDIEEDFIKSAIFDLLAAGLLESRDGRIRTSLHRASTKNDCSHDDASKYYELVCDLAKKAIKTPLDEREFSTFSMAIAHEDMPLAKEMIRKCRNSLSSLSKGKTLDRVYQANLMLFPLTE